MLEEEFQRILESGSNTLQQVFSGIRTVRSFSGEAHEKARWDAWIRRHWEVRAKTETLHNLILILPTHIVDRVLMGVVFGVGALEIISGRLSVGDLIAFMMYTPYVYTALRAMLQAQVTTEKIKLLSKVSMNYSVTKRSDRVVGNSRFRKGQALQLNSTLCLLTMEEGISPFAMSRFVFGLGNFSGSSA